MSDDSTPTPRERHERLLADLRRGGMTDRELAAKHGYSRQRIQQIRRRSGIPRYQRPPAPPKPPKPPRPSDPRRWTPEQVAYLVEHAGETDADIGAAINRSPRSVATKRVALVRVGRIAGRASRWSDPGTGDHSPFSVNELAVILDGTLTNRAAAALIGRTPGAIRAERHRRGVDYQRERTRRE